MEGLRGGGMGWRTLRESSNGGISASSYPRNRLKWTEWEREGNNTTA